MHGVTQVLAVKARLMQDHPDVDLVAGAYLGGFVNRLTAATIYVATGCDLKRCRTVADKARISLRLFRRADSDARARLYEAKLAQLCLELAVRTTTSRRRKANHQRQP